jgi:hypothetical protein
MSLSNSRELPIVIAGSAVAAAIALVIAFRAKQESKGGTVTIKECCHARVGKYSCID